jgi:hypothetical protein
MSSVSRRPRADWDDDVAVVYPLVVEEPPEWGDTGLVDPDGRPIRRRLKRPIGFTADWTPEYDL